MSFQILDDKAHILLRPNMYCGSVTSELHNQFLNYQWQQFQYVPGLFKIINELIDNSIDEFIRTGGAFANQIDIKVTDKSFWIKDNGRGIPVSLTKDLDGEDIYTPVAAWCKTKAGSNFGADTDRDTIGMNGVGSALANIFSSKFIGTTSDGKFKLVVECDDNATIRNVDVKKSTKKFTEVYIEPEFARFGVESIDDTLKSLILNRLNNLAVCYPAITFKYNDEPIKLGTPKAWMTKFAEEHVLHSDDGVIIGIMNSPDEEFRCLSLVNGLSIINGGSHIDYIMGQLCDVLREGIKKKHKLEVTPGQIKSHLQLVSVIRGMKNMKFDSQTKERITNPRGEVSGYFESVKFDKLAASILKNDALIMPIIQAQLAKQMAADARAATMAEKAVAAKTVAKHIPATGRYSNEKTLFIAEGDSAIGPFVSARTEELKKIYGGYPLRGKIPNVTGMKTSKILETKELGELINILGLKIGQKVVNPNYGTIAIMTDQDLDGFSIQGLLLNFFWLWPELYQLGRVKIVKTPLYVATKKDDRKYFYDKSEFDLVASKLKGYEIRYIKGLGSLRKAEYKDILSNPVMVTVKIDDPSLFDAMYGDYIKFGDARKKLIGDV